MTPQEAGRLGQAIRTCKSAPWLFEDRVVTCSYPRCKHQAAPCWTPEQLRARELLEDGLAITPTRQSYGRDRAY